MEKEFRELKAISDKIADLVKDDICKEIHILLKGNVNTYQNKYKHTVATEKEGEKVVIYLCSYGYSLSVGGFPDIIEIAQYANKFNIPLNCTKAMLNKAINILQKLYDEIIELKKNE